MTDQETAAIVARQLAAETAYLEARSSFPGIRAERRRILEETERELAAAVAEVLRAHVCTASGCPTDGAGFPDGTERSAAYPQARDRLS